MLRQRSARQARSLRFEAVSSFDKAGRELRELRKPPAIRPVHTSGSPFHRRASTMSATMPTALTTNMPRKAFWPQSA